MIGNDIIDLQLAAAQSNWRRNGFLNKLFTEKEQSVILNSEDPFQTVWLFWSMKESAYKAYVQKFQRRFFAPKKFECTMTSPTTGIVDTDDACYMTTSQINSVRIFTEATVMSRSDIEHYYFENDAKISQSNLVYKQIKKIISRKLTLPINELRIKKNAVGIPNLYIKNKRIKVSISISHHGKFGAFSILNNS